jgi:mRNA interferase HigB
VRVVAIRTLREFWKKHPDAEQPLRAWYGEASQAKWTQPADIKAHYRSASILGNRRVVFNIKGNDYRLVVAVAYNVGVVFVKFVGTHRAYDAIDAESVEME